MEPRIGPARTRGDRHGHGSVATASTAAAIPLPAHAPGGFFVMSRRAFRLLLVLAVAAMAAGMRGFLAEAPQRPDSAPAAASVASAESPSATVPARAATAASAQVPAATYGGRRQSCTGGPPSGASWFAAAVSLAQANNAQEDDLLWLCKDNPKATLVAEYVVTHDPVTSTSHIAWTLYPGLYRSEVRRPRPVMCAAWLSRAGVKARLHQHAGSRRLCGVPQCACCQSRCQRCFKPTRCTRPRPRQMAELINQKLSELPGK